MANFDLGFINYEQADREREMAFNAAFDLKRASSYVQANQNSGNKIAPISDFVSSFCRPCEGYNFRSANNMCAIDRPMSVNYVTSSSSFNHGK